MNMTPHSTRHPEVASLAALEGRRPGFFILRGALKRAFSDERYALAQR
jgi:hypothetical protein